MGLTKNKSFSIILLFISLCLVLFSKSYALAHELETEETIKKTRVVIPGMNGWVMRILDLENEKRLAILPPSEMNPGKVDIIVAQVLPLTDAQKEKLKQKKKNSKKISPQNISIEDQYDYAFEASFSYDFKTRKLISFSTNERSTFKNGKMGGFNTTYEMKNATQVVFNGKVYLEFSGFDVTGYENNSVKKEKKKSIVVFFPLELESDYTRWIYNNTAYYLRSKK